MGKNGVPSRMAQTSPENRNEREIVEECRRYTPKRGMFRSHSISSAEKVSDFEIIESLIETCGDEEGSIARQSTDEQFECRADRQHVPSEVASHHRQLVEIGGECGYRHAACDTSTGRILQTMCLRGGGMVKSWLDVVDALYQGSWSQDLQRFRSPFAFRGLNRAIAHACQFAAPTRPTGSRHRQARGRAPAKLSQVRARPGDRRRLDLGLARARAASRSSDAPSRLDVFAARRAALRDGEYLRVRPGRNRLVRQFRQGEQAPAGAIEADAAAGRIRYVHRRDAVGVSSRCASSTRSAASRSSCFSNRRPSTSESSISSRCSR